MRPLTRKLNALLASLSVGTKRTRPFNKPTHIFLEVTTRCNLSCVMCGRTHDPRYKSESCVGDMPLALVKKLDGIYGRSSFVIATGLGEPFLNPEFIDILRHLKKRKATVSLTSNGTVLSEDQAQALVNEGIDRIVFSIDSPDPETFRRIRLGANLDQILRNLEKLVELRAKSGRRLPYLILEFVAMAKNFHQLPQIADLAHRLNFDEVIVQNLFKHFAPGYDSFYRRNKLSVLEPAETLAHWEEFQRRLKHHGISFYSPLQSRGIQLYLRRSGNAGEPESRATSYFVGYIDQPAPLERLSGSCRVTGWVLGKKGFPFTEIGFESSTEALHVPITSTIERRDVLSSLPSTHPQNPQCGFDQMVDLSELEPGIYTLSLKVRDSEEQTPQTMARQQIVLSTEENLRMYCTQPWSTIYVTWNGIVRTCCFNEYALGNLAHASFPQLWEGQAFIDFRQKVIRGNVLEACADCLAGKSMPNYVSSLKDFFLR